MKLHFNVTLTAYDSSLWNVGHNYYLKLVPMKDCYCEKSSVSPFFVLTFVHLAYITLDSLCNVCLIKIFLLTIIITSMSKRLYYPSDQVHFGIQNIVS